MWTLRGCGLQTKILDPQQTTINCMRNSVVVGELPQKESERKLGQRKGHLAGGGAVQFSLQTITPVVHWGVILSWQVWRGVFTNTTITSTWLRKAAPLSATGCKNQFFPILTDPNPECVQFAYCQACNVFRNIATTRKMLRFMNVSFRIFTKRLC